MAARRSVRRPLRRAACASAARSCSPWLSLNRPPGAIGRALARSAYAAYVAQLAVLIGLAVALRGADLPAEIKALAVAGLGVAGSFALAWLLVTRTRLGRIL